MGALLASWPCGVHAHPEGERSPFTRAWRCFDECGRVGVSAGTGDCQIVSEACRVAIVAVRSRCGVDRCVPLRGRAQQARRAGEP